MSLSVTRNVWPCTKAGQYNFVKDLVDALLPLDNVDGISYWFPEEAGNGDYVNWTSKTRIVIDPWLNRGFWDETSTTSGHAINKTGAVTGGKTSEDVCAPYYMKNFYNGSEGFEETTTSPLHTEKVIINQQLLIRAHTSNSADAPVRYFTVTGQEVKP